METCTCCQHPCDDINVHCEHCGIRKQHGPERATGGLVTGLSPLHAAEERWKDLYNSIQVMAVGSEARMEWERYRCLLDILHLMDRKR